MHLFKGLIPNINISVSLNNLTTYQDMFIKKNASIPNYQCILYYQNYK
jgi:hypothetical protein